MLPEMDELGRVIRTRAAELGLTQAELAQRTGVHPRQIRRYVRNEQQPALNVAKCLAEALDLSLDELAGSADDPLNGTWWTARQVRVDEREFVITVDATLTAKRDVIGVEGRGWRGELRRGETLVGWYVDEHGQQGTMLFVLKEEGVAIGRWVGTTAEQRIVSGHAALARTREAAQAAIGGLAG
jgi:transcriptional regulator with XRE-family HTH domain